MSPRVAVLPVLLLLAACAPLAQAAPTGPDEVLTRTVAATADPHAHDAEVAAFEASATHATLVFQHRLADDVGLADAPWAGTHNSFNSVAEMGTTVSDSDSNQQLALVDQLRLGVRSLELDVHWFPSAAAGGYAPVVCHAESQHEGCSLEKPLGTVLEEIAGWLRANPGEVILLYLEDHLDGSEGHDAAAAALGDRLGPLLYRPGACTRMPRGLTRAAVLAAGAQVVAVASGCGAGAAWPAAVLDWDGHVEARPRAFDPATCGPDFDRATYDTTLVRYFEDSTGLTTAASYAGQATTDDGLTPETSAAMVRCGVDLFGFDQLLPGDGRLEAIAWSWADGVPAASAGTCAVQQAAGRWTAQPCATRWQVACRTPAGAWSVPPRAVRAEDAAKTCVRAGATFAVPRTGRENVLLRAAAGDAPVLLGLRASASGWTPADAR